MFAGPPEVVWFRSSIGLVLGSGAMWWGSGPPLSSELKLRDLKLNEDMRLKFRITESVLYACWSLRSFVKEDDIEDWGSVRGR